MTRLMLVASVALLCAQQARPSAIVYYTGDPNGQAGYGDYQDLSGKVNIVESQVFQNFSIPAGVTWDVTSIYLNETDLGPSNVTEATWSIRAGMARGNGGTVLFSGTSPATEGAGAISQITVAGLNIDLPAGEYWMNVTLQANGTKLLADTTGGLNAINATQRQAGLWYESQYQNYTPVKTDFSMGITADVAVAATPEPASWVLMAGALCGFGAVWKARGAAPKPCAVGVRVARSNRDSRR